MPKVSFITGATKNKFRKMRFNHVNWLGGIHSHVEQRHELIKLVCYAFFLNMAIGFVSAFDAIKIG